MTNPLDKLKKAGRLRPSSSSEQAGSGRNVDEANGSDHTRFRSILEGISDADVEKRLDRIMGDIRKLSDLLGRRRLLEDLEDYRSKVGEFLKLYLSEVFDVRQAQGRRGFSKHKQMIVVKKVNIELEELSRMVLGGGTEFDIIRELDTIQGLLMDLYR